MVEGSVTGTSWYQDAPSAVPYVSPLYTGMVHGSAVNRTKLTLDDDPENPENGIPTLVNPASSLLQDLLKEQRANRGSQGPASEDWDDNGPRTPERTGMQEDTASEKARKVNDAFSAGLRKPQEMGMREMDQVGPSVE